MNIEKYKNAAVRMIVEHNLRLHEHYSNENVDPSLSHLNIKFIERDFDYYKKRLKNDLYVYGGWNGRTKEKYNSLCSICVNCPLDYQDEEGFYTAVNDILEKRYGKDNVICSIVHNDERAKNGTIKRSHLHFSFIPCIYNEKKKKYQLSYEKCIAHYFDTFHKDIEKELRDNYGIDVKMSDPEANKDKFYFNHINEYKEYKEALDKLKDKVEEFEQIRQVMQKELDDVIKKYDDAVDKYNVLNKDHNALVDKYNALGEEFNTLSEDYSALLEEHKKLEEFISTKRMLYVPSETDFVTQQLLDLQNER